MKILTDNQRLETVIALAKILHKNQLDKAGEEYLGHLQRVANKQKTVSAKIVAYLHDAAEDGLITHGQLGMLGFLTGHELYCLRVLDKNYRGNDLSFEHRYNMYDNKNYYIKNVKSLKITRLVKIADIEDNMDIGRFARNGIELQEKDMARLKKYDEQLRYLRDV